MDISSNALPIVMGYESLQKISTTFTPVQMRMVVDYDWQRFLTDSDPITYLEYIRSKTDSEKSKTEKVLKKSIDSLKSLKSLR